jgi:hypothetical protein
MTAWDKIKKYLSYTWASPVTAFGLLYVVPCRIMGWYKWYGVCGDALVWTVNNDKIPAWLTNYWKKFSGHASGQVVVLKHPPDLKEITLRHEQQHVLQTLRLGLFWPVFYYGSMAAIKFGCPQSDAYYDNPFEIDARRAAGQVIDVVGMTKKIVEGKKSDPS